MNKSKADFFDSEIESDWSSNDYTPEELAKLERIFQASELKPGDMVIEPGCGTGRLTKLIAERIGPSGVVVASDISPKMIAKAHDRLRNYENVQIFLEEIEKVPVCLKSFDMVLCHNVFPHFDDKFLITSKLATALKPNGKMVVSHFMNSSGVNSLHRKTNPAVAKDFLPENEQMQQIFSGAGLVVEYIVDDDKGYLLKAHKK